MNNLPEKLSGVVDIETALLEIHKLEEQIQAAADKRDKQIEFFRGRIDKARKNFETDTTRLQFEIDSISVTLKRYFDENPPVSGKSHKFAGGTFGYRKQDPRYTIGDTEANADNPELLKFVKDGHNEFLRVKETVNWKKLKTALSDDGGNVFIKDTGEIIPGMKAFTQPDKFIVRTVDYEPTD